jgi:hypothetical protein
MSRNAFYLKTLHSLPEPATLMEIQSQATSLFGLSVKASTQSVRSSIERYVTLGKVTRITDEDGITRYWITGKPVDLGAYLLNKMARLKAELRDARIEWDEFQKQKACNAQPACYDATTPTQNEA